MADSLRLFLVEDEEDFAYLLRKTLERAGHRVAGCRTAADALIVLGSTPYDLVILDHELPDMGGLELLHQLKQEGITTPVLMVTGRGNERLATQVLRAGALDYVVKDAGLLAELPKRVSESVTLFQLQQMNRLLIAALESARDGVMITDLQGAILHVNQSLEGITGYSRQELLGQNPRLLKSDVHGAEVFEGLWHTILNRQSWQGVLTNRRKNGTRFDTSLTVSPIVDSRGQLTHFVGIYRDESERKQIERQLFQAQKMQSVGTLAGGVAHEFNNLLAGIQGYAALGLRETGLSESIKQFLQYIVDLSDRAANLTRQLLAFARKPALSRQPTSMQGLLTATAELVRHSLQLDVHVELPPKVEEPLEAQVDANQLQQVLVNLALNARDALTQPAQIIFRLRHVVLPGDLSAFPQSVPAGDYVVLEVEDCGRGMSPEILNQALDPFFTTKEIGQGTGLGLPVAFGIIQGHQGYLTIASQEGKGTCASLYLPRLTTRSSEARRQFDEATVLEPDSAPGRRILVIDDEESVLDVVRRFLEIAGHTVSVAQNTTQALDMLGENPVELVILDLMIPHEDGLENYQALQQKCPGAPVLLCTGLLQADSAARLLQEGAAGLIRKPFRMNELWYAVNRALEQANPPKASLG